MGDVVQGLPALTALKESLPGVATGWLVEEPHAPLLRGHPHLDRLWVLPRWTQVGPADYLLRSRDLARELRAFGYDVAIDLQGLLKSAVWARVSGAPRRLGEKQAREGAALLYTEFSGTRDVFDPDYPLHRRYLDPAVALGADPAKARFVLPEMKPREDFATRLKAIPRDKPWVAFAPHSLWDTKNWPDANWAALARDLSSRAEIFLVGSADDRPALEEIVKAAPAARNLAGETGLEELVALFRNCRAAIGADTGPMHLANAAGVPRLVMLFGSTSRRRSGPWGEGHRSLALDLPCQPCFERRCPLVHFHCLRNLQGKTVLSAALDAIHPAETHA